MRPFLLGIRLSLVLVSLGACVALKLVTDVMAWRAEQLVHAHARKDEAEISQRWSDIESWSFIGDCIGWGIGAFVLLSGTLSIVGGYLAYRPLFGIAATMRRFASGEHQARAESSRFVELAMVADDFNDMADAITGQHQQTLNCLSLAAQELREPAQMMKVALQAFVPGQPLPPEQVIRSRLAIVSREVERLGRIIDTYLEANRVEWKRLDLQLGRQDLGEVVGQAAGTYRAYSAVHQLEVSVPEHPLWSHSDPSQMSQVIHTLVMNAIQRSPRGGVIEVMARGEDGEIVVDVVDHGGVGIPRDQIGRVFEPFRHVSEGHRNGACTSVAMAVAKRIVEAHQGRIEVTSEVGEGSTFRVHLPRAGETGEAQGGE